MKLSFLADQCVPSDISDTLRRHGHKVTLLNECLPIRSPDSLVIAKAQELDCLLLSLNGDFSDIVTYPPSDFAGIVAVQLHNHPEIIPSLMANFIRFLDSITGREYLRGKLLIVEVHRIRIRA